MPTRVTRAPACMRVSFQRRPMLRAADEAAADGHRVLRCIHLSQPMVCEGCESSPLLHVESGRCDVSRREPLNANAALRAFVRCHRGGTMRSTRVMRVPATHSGRIPPEMCVDCILVVLVRTQRR